MIKNKRDGGVTVVVGAQYGSEAKGVIAAALADLHHASVRTGGPNAGHTFWHDGAKRVQRSIPCAWANPLCELYIGAGAVIDPLVLAAELDAIPDLFWGNRHIMVDGQAALVLPGDREHEADGLVAAIGSTAEGIGQARIRKMQRMNHEVLARDFEFWHPRVRLVDDVSEHLYRVMATGGRVLLEGSQGSALSLHHGSWPYVTSSDTNAAQFLADAGIAPAWVDHTYLVARTYPIRVGGNSGPMGEELDWADVPGVTQPEITTVTKRQRRIAAWSDELFAKAIRLNRPCGIFLMFTDYLDPSIAGSADLQEIRDSRPVMEFVHRIERKHNVPVIGIGTGGQSYSLVQSRPCSCGGWWRGQS